MQISERARTIAPFYVMEVAKAASDLAQRQACGDRPMVFLNIGEPDFTAPPLVQEAARRAITQGYTQYTPALGLPRLRECISQWYSDRFHLSVAPERIVVTAGASAALHLVCMALVDAGQEILLPDPSYPCNRHFVLAAQGIPKLVPTTAEDRFQLTAQQVEQHWGTQTRGVLLASPSNPTGTSIAPQALRALHEAVRARAGLTIVDEIYLGLSFDAHYGQSALALGEDLISINSFSKYFNLTGWRLGWVVAPTELIPVLERLAQNLYICPSAIAQHAALACFEPESLACYEQRRLAFQQRRDYFLPQLQAAGLPVPVIPDGAFYAWADCTEACARLQLASSWELAFALMDRIQVAVTPGRDFGSASTGHFLRFSTASSLVHLQEAAQRLQTLFKA